MRIYPFSIFSVMTLALLSIFTMAPKASYADTTISLDKAVHFTTAEGADVVLEVGEYVVEPAEEWVRIIPSGGSAVDALLLEAQVGKHDESLEALLAISETGEQTDVHHLVLLVPDGQRFESVGTYSGIRSRGRLSRLSIKRLRALAAKRRSAQRTEFATPSFGGTGGNRSYNLDCGNRAVLVGSTYKAGLWFDAIGIICQRVNPQTGELESEFTRGPVGGGGGQAKIVRCGQGRVVQGIKAKSGQYINRIFMRCGRWEPSRKAPIFGEICNPNTPACPDFGGPTVAPQSDLFVCPQGTVGKAFRGKHGTYIDSMKFVCDFWDK